MTALILFLCFAALALVGNHMLGAELNFKERMWSSASVVVGVIGMACVLYFAK